MAAKKNTAKKKPKTPADCVSPEGSMRLDDVSRLTLLRWDAETRAAERELVVQKAALSAYLKSIDPQGHIGRQQAGIAAVEGALQKARAEYAAALSRAEAKLGVLMRDYSYDDESGLLHKNVEDTTTKGK